jgi:hypothetical protein
MGALTEIRMLHRLPHRIGALLLLLGLCGPARALSTATFTITGAELSPGGVPDTGTITISVNNQYSESVTYGQFSTPSSIAAAFAAEFSQNPVTEVQASPSRLCTLGICAKADGSTIVFQLADAPFQSISFNGSTADFQGLLMPHILGISPGFAAVGTIVTLSGTNFGSTGTVTFNGNAATPVNWTNSSITVVVPPGTGVENVVVQAYGMVSNSFPFTAISPTPTNAVNLTAQGTAPYYYGQPLQLIAHVNSGATGSVSFTEDGVALPAVALAGGVASYTITGLAFGQHAFAATYSGDASNTSGTSNTLSLAVQTNPTTTVVTLSPITSWLGYPVLANVTVAAAGGTVPTAGGMVNCSSNPAPSQAILPVALNGTSKLAQVLIKGLPLTASGASYTVSCAFTSANTSEYSSSTAAPVLGTVINAPVPTSEVTAGLLTPRYDHQATSLMDGSILVTGGQNTISNAVTNPNDLNYFYGNGQVLSSSEIYFNGGFSAAAQMTTPRTEHQATLLGNGTGQVLITGGNDGNSTLKTAEIFTPGSEPGAPGSFSATAAYDSSTGAFTGPVTTMSAPRLMHTATLLPNGQVLIAGGKTSDGSILGAAETYDPQSGTFTLTGPMTTARYEHTATLLPDGTVLLVGGIDNNGNYLSSAEIYTPSTRQFTAVSAMLHVRALAQATLIGDGTVLITGGDYPVTTYSHTQATVTNTPLAESEIYNPTSQTFTLTQDKVTHQTTVMLEPRFAHTSTVLYDGTVLIAGGNGGAGSLLNCTYAENCTPEELRILDGPASLYGPTAADETYNPWTGDFTSIDTVTTIQLPANQTKTVLTGGLLTPRMFHTANLLPSGGVLLAGGQSLVYIPGGNSGRIPPTDLYIPAGQPGVGDGGPYGNYASGGYSAEIYAATNLSGGLYPKYMVMDILYAPPGSGSSITYSGNSTIGNSTNNGNSFMEQLMLNTSSAKVRIDGTAAGKQTYFSGVMQAITPSYTVNGILHSYQGDGAPANPHQGTSQGSLEFDYTYQVTGNTTYSLTTSSTNSTVVPGPSSATPGVDHESDIVNIWLNPATDYTVASPNEIVWNGYDANPEDTNVAPGQMDIIQLTVGQLDGTSPIPPALQEILDRNWDPVSAGGIGGLTQQDMLTILKRDPFATNTALNQQRSTAVTSAPAAPVAPIFDPNIPTLDTITGSCGGRYSFDSTTGQTFPYSPLSNDNQANTSVYTLLNSTTTQSHSQTNTDTYSVGLSASLDLSHSPVKSILSAAGISDTMTWSYSWNPQSSNALTGSETLSIKNPAPGSYAGPSQIQVWKDNLYNTYMFYPKPDDTTVNLSSTQITSNPGDAITITATVVPDAIALAKHGVPTGTVTFYDGCTNLGNAVLSSAGTATLSYMWPTDFSETSIGSHTVRALYSGDNNYFHNVGNSLALTVDDPSHPQPYISGITPSTGPIGTTVTISGSNLGSSAFAASVTFNGIPANAVWLSSTSVQTTVPAGATTGPVTITTGQGVSKTGSFTVTQPTSVSTTATLELAPATAWTGYPVVANVLVSGSGTTVPPGTVSCTSSPSTGATNPTATVDPGSGVAQVAILDMPVLAQGSSTPQSYTETCAFTPSNTALFSSSQSNVVSGTIIPVPAATTYNTTSELDMPRENQQATLLNDGTVLITGGDAGKYAGKGEDGPYVDYLQSTEIYMNGAFTLAAEMTTSRTLHQATLLSNGTGQVLITGGTNGTALASAELFTPGATPGAPGTFSLTTLYDPAAKGFTTTVSNMNTPRFWHTATLLPNGKVLIAGGTSTMGNFDPSQSSYMVTAGANGTRGSSLATAELFDPLTGKFTYTSGPMTTARSRHTATLLTDGTVLIAGGIDIYGDAIRTAEIYDPATDTFHATSGNMMGGRIKAQATRLGDGTVLITGGSIGVETNSGCPGFRVGGCARNDAEIYNPATETFTPTQYVMGAARYSHTATMLPNGTVLVAGGLTDLSGGSNNASQTEEIFDPTSGQFTAITNLVDHRYNHSATSLPSGGVLLVGGAFGDMYGALPLGYPGNPDWNAEMYSPPLLSSGAHPKFMVLNVMYAPPGSGSSVGYTDNTQIGTTTTTTHSDTTALSIGLSGTVGIKSVGATIGATGNFTFAQNSADSYAVNTTTMDATTVPGPSKSGVGVDHEADVIWVWLNPESDFTLTTPSKLIWTGYATNQNDPNVASGQMDIIPLTVGQLDGTTPIPDDLRELLDRNWDSIASGGAGPITAADLVTILQRDPFAVNLTPNTASAAPTNLPIPSNPNYPVVDPNIPTHDANSADPNECGQRYKFDPVNGQTFQYAALGSTNQPLTQTYSLQTNTTKTNGSSISDTYFVSLSLGVCFGIGGECKGSPSATDNNKAGASINLSLGYKYTWGLKNASTSSNQSIGTQALSIKNPLPGDNYGGPVQMQVWQDTLYGTYMFYPKATDTTVALSSSQITTQAGDSVTFIAVVTPDPSLLSSGNGLFVPGGDVTFYDGCNVIGGGPQPLVNGIAIVNTSWPSSSPATHTIQAVYSGDDVYFHNDAPALTETVRDNTSNLPYINGITPTSGSAGTVVTINGKNFGTSGYAVTFNGIPASATSPYTDVINATVPAGATTGPIVVTANNYSSNGVLFTVTNPPATTTTTLMLSPMVSLSGYPASAHVVVIGAGGLPITGSVSCNVTSPAGTASTPSVALNSTTSSVDISLPGLPTVPSGASATAAYTASCTFASSNSNYTGSQSNQVIGTVTNAPAATNTPTTGLNVARENQQANLLQDGTVLITGGDDADGDALSSTEIFSGNSFTLASPMSVARTLHQATLLSDSTGQVLVTGGTDAQGNVYSSAELFTPGPVPSDPGSFNATTLYDPTAKAFTTTVTSMNVARFLHTATQLVSGKVLIAGGLDANGNPLSSAELYDPTTGNFTLTSGSLQVARYAHTATLLSDGTVLIAGGTSASGEALNIAEIYNPVSDSFTLTQTPAPNKSQTFMATGRTQAGAVMLAGGTVLIAGGVDSYGNPLNSAELYSPATGIFTSTQNTSGPTSMNAARYAHSVTLLPDGTVLVAGGQGTGGSALSSQEVYDPTTGNFNISASEMITARSNHTATLMSNGSILLAGGFNEGALNTAEVFSTTISSTALFPKFMVLDVLYAPPGAGSTMTYTDATSVGSTMSTDTTFSSAHTFSISVSFPIPNTGITLSPGFGWGHTATQDGTSSFAFNTTTTNTLVVPGAVAAGTAGTGKVSTGVDHEADNIRIWLNPATIYTVPSQTSDTLIWNGLASNPNDPNVAPGAMDIVSLTVSQLDGTSPIPPELRAVLDRNWDSIIFGGAGSLTPANFQTILQRDPFATNTSLNRAPAVVNGPDSYFDPNIPVMDPITNLCSTRYNFDPLLGQSFAFGQLGSTNQPFTQNYSLLSTKSNVKGNTMTDQYSVENSIDFSIGVRNRLSLTLNNTNTFTWTNVWGKTKTNDTAVTQALSIKNPVASDNYTGPTQMQVWQDKLYGTFMFYPKATDTNITLASSQGIADPGETVVLTAALTADPKVAASTNPPLAPTGAVTFYDGCTSLGTVQLDSTTGLASIPVSALTAGTHNILAAYSGDSHFLHNVSPSMTQIIVDTAATAPYISGLSITAGSVGDPVTIHGYNFGSSGTVSFNGIAAAPASAWTSTSITVNVPTSATTGDIVVTSNSVASNGVSFVVNQPAGATTTSVSLMPAVVFSGFPTVANVVVTSAAGNIPSGAISCVVASSTSTGTPAVGNLDATGAAAVTITDLPLVPANGAPVPFAVTCSYAGNTSFTSSQSAAVSGSVIALPNAKQSTAGNLNISRENGQAGLMEDGTILVTGGDENGMPLSSAEIYVNGSFNLANFMLTPRTGHQETVLDNGTGQVLITGGSNGGGALASAELFTPGTQPGMPGSFRLTTQYSPAAQVFTNIATAMTSARNRHTATLLTTGKVLIAGGSDANGNALATAELFDPATGTFTATSGAMNYARIGHNATLLFDGTVLIAGGIGSNGQPLTSAEIYNPLTNHFTVTQTSNGSQTYMNIARVNDQATRLGSGQVLISGGQGAYGNGFNSAEIYDPATGTFRFTQGTGSVQTYMTAARYGHSASLLYDGTVLIAGGQDTSTDTLSTMESYNPVTGTFSSVGAGLLAPRHGHTATVLPTTGVLIAGGANTTTGGSYAQASSEMYSPYTLVGGLHPKFMVLNIQYAPPGSGSSMTYSNAATIGTSTGTENSFQYSASVATSVGVNFGIFTLTDTVTNTWTNTQDNTSSVSLSSQTTNSDVVPGPTSSSLGVDHESDVIWIWLNPVANYTITSPNSFVWNGFGTDPDDPNSIDGSMDVIPLSVSQLDGTSPITQAEWDILDRNWDPVSEGGAGPVTTADFFSTILPRDPFAVNLTGVGRSTAPTTAPTGNLYPLFDPNVPTLDPVTNQCGNRYDFSPGFDMTFPYAQLGSTNQAFTQNYSLGTTVANGTSTTTTDTYKVAISSNFTFNQAFSVTGGQPFGVSGDPNAESNILDNIGATNNIGAAPDPNDPRSSLQDSFSESLKISGSMQWTNKWNSSKNNSTLQTQALSIKNPLPSDHYTGPEQIQVWKDNLYGTFMFYPRPSDTEWLLTTSQTTASSGSSVTFTATVTADPLVPAVPTGTVTFYDGCTKLNSEPVDVASGTATLTTPLSSTGTHNIVAIYSGDTNFYHNNSNSLVVAVQ